MTSVLEEAGVDITKENKKDIDKTLHKLAGIEYKNCSSTWKALKKMLQNEEERKLIVQGLKKL